MGSLFFQILYLRAFCKKNNHSLKRQTSFLSSLCRIFNNEKKSRRKLHHFSNVCFLKQFVVIHDVETTSGNCTYDLWNVFMASASPLRFRLTCWWRATSLALNLIRCVTVLPPCILQDMFIARCIYKTICLQRDLFTTRLVYNTTCL